MIAPVLVFVCLGLSEAAATGRNPAFTPTLPPLTPATATFPGRVTTIEPPTTDPTTTTPGAFGHHQKAGQSGSMSDRANGQDLVCNCSVEGALEPDECDRDTGQCVCMVGYTGLQCEECEEDHFTNGTDGCLPCGCDSFGAISPRCDSSGTCVCKTGVYGPKCDDCHPGFFHFSSTGCQPCQCNQHSTYCHPQSGVCLDCQDNTQGQNCEECVPRFYRASGSSVKDGCVPCPCAVHSSSGTCHLDASGSPACDECKAGFQGLACDVCMDGLYKSGDVCVPCDCNGNADPRSVPQMCHQESGQCLRCANHTAGMHCELCAPGYTGDARAHNCTLRAVRLLPTLAPKSSTTTAPHTTTTTTVSSSPATSPFLLLTFSAPSSTPTLQSGPLDPAANNSTASALTVVSWTQFNIIVLAVIIAVVVLLMALVGGVYTYREYRNRKLNAPFWTIELKEDNISFSSYHDSIPHADPNGLLEEEPCVVAANGQLALATAANMYKA
ncbi:multiple epidermal growth factor-like domains protein 9 [Salminus brasiliensis]|uniref:multiple epidermal growth factor-like domains protein 9 n=1 Tax=Salminus brasiliensis TaxID=930266 RepID=UPI003B82E7A5